MIESPAQYAWPPEELKDAPLSFAVFVGQDPSIQPGFAIMLHWNKPGIDRRPFFVVQLWRKHLNVGWVFD